MINLLYARAGDVFFTHSETVLGKLIRWAETDPGETNGTWANHAGVVVEDGWIARHDIADLPPGFAEAEVVEALWKTRRGSLDVSNIEVRVFRPVPPLTPAELTRFRERAGGFVGATYGWWKLGIQLADRAIFKGTKVLTTAMNRDDRPICSYLAAKVYAAAESQERIVARFKRWNNVTAVFAFGIPPQAADPDEMLDYCLANPDEWEEVLAIPTPRGRAYVWTSWVERIVARFKSRNNVTAVFAFGIPPQSADPDEMLDYCLANPNEWEEVLAIPTPPETKREEATERKDARAAEVVK